MLWLPESGWVDETVNGHPLLAEPGTAMFCLPGDELQGDTTPVLKGILLPMPASLLGDPDRWHGLSLHLLAHAYESMTAIHMALEIVSALRTTTDDLEQLVAVLADRFLYMPPLRKVLMLWPDCHIREPSSLPYLVWRNPQANASLIHSPRWVQLPGKRLPWITASRLPGSAAQRDG